MPLNAKPVSNSTARFLTWLRCLPCNIVCGVCCCVFCSCKTGAKIICAPLVDGPIQLNAEAIANGALLLDSSQPVNEKLAALITPSWDASYLLTDLAMQDSLHKKLRSELKSQIITVLNKFNLGNVPSELLDDDQRKYIGESLRNAIINKLPSMIDFDLQVFEAGIPTNDSVALNQYLANLLLKIIKSDLVRIQLAIISRDIENHATPVNENHSDAIDAIFDRQFANMDKFFDHHTFFKNEFETQPDLPPSYNQAMLSSK